MGNSTSYHRLSYSLPFLALLSSLALLALFLPRDPIEAYAHVAKGRETVTGDLGRSPATALSLLARLA